MVSSMTVDQAKASVRQLEKVCATRGTVDNLVRLSTCYFILGDLESAIPLIELAYQKDPHNPVVAVNLALAWKDYGDHEGAYRLLKVVYDEMDPEDRFVRLAYSESLLRQGLWEEAWPIYNSARDSKEEAALTAGIPVSVREWDGKKKPDRLVVVDEGGFGDSITFSSFLPLLTSMGTDWIYLPFPELRGFYERASWCGPQRLAQTGMAMNVSHWTTTQSLPGNLGVMSGTGLSHLELFKALPKFETKYKITKRPTLGLCWRGGDYKNGGRKVKSMTEGQAMRLVCRTDHLVNWVNLQYDVKMPEPVTNVRFSTWEELAGLMMNLDAVVSVESGPMCLAHALGRKLIIVLSANSDWRFMDRGNSPFYPLATIFRNEKCGIEQAVDKTISYVSTNWDEKKRLVLVG